VSWSIQQKEKGKSGGGGGGGGEGARHEGKKNGVVPAESSRKRLNHHTKGASRDELKVLLGKEKFYGKMQKGEKGKLKGHGGGGGAWGVFN